MFFILQKTPDSYQAHNSGRHPVFRDTEDGFPRPFHRCQSLNFREVSVLRDVTTHASRSASKNRPRDLICVHDAQDSHLLFPYTFLKTTCKCDYDNNNDDEMW